MPEVIQLQMPPTAFIELIALMAGPAVALIGGVAQCVLIWLGIQAMQGSNTNREDSLATLAKQNEAMDHQNKVLAEVSAGLRELLLRTATT